MEFYIWHVNDTLLIVENEQIDLILKELNNCNIYIKFNVDLFKNKDVHFLDIKIYQINTDIYFKDIHTSQNINYCTKTPSKLKTSRIKMLYYNKHKICSNKNSLNKQLSQNKPYMSWSGYPNRARNCVIKPLDTNKLRQISTDDDDRKKIWLDLLYNRTTRGTVAHILSKETKTFNLKRTLTSLLTTTEPKQNLWSVQLKIA